MGFFRKLFGSRSSEQAPSTVPTAVAPDQLSPTPAPAADHAEETQAAEESRVGDEADAPWWASPAPVAVDTPLPGPIVEEQIGQPARGTAPLAEILHTEAEIEQAPLESEPAILDDAQAEATAEELAHSAPTPAAGTPKPNGTRQLSTHQAPEMVRHASAQGLAAAALRDVGRVRQINQDSVFALLTTLPRESGDLTLGLFIVADGMGGHDSGEVASKLAVGSVARHVLAQIVLPALEDMPAEALQPVMIEAVQEANRTIWNHAQAVGSDMGTTCTAVLMLGAALFISHVGDSRAYVLEPDGLRLLTTDHSAVGRLIQLGQLEPSEAREHPMRSQLYRTVGQQPDVLVDFVYHHLGAGSHLLLGSDGLWGMLSEERMTAVLDACTWPQDACRELVALANLAGGEDNISAVVVSFHVAERAPA